MMILMIKNIYHVTILLPLTDDSLKILSISLKLTYGSYPSDVMKLVLDFFKTEDVFRLALYMLDVCRLDFPISTLVFNNC